MKKITLTLLALLLSLALAMPLLAIDRQWERGHGMRDAARDHDGAGMPPFFDKLNLTAEQKAKLAELRLAHRQDIKPLRDQMISKRGDLRLLWLQPAPDKEKILALQKEIRGIREQLADKATAFRVDLFNLLTPEQKEKAKALFPRPGFGPGPGKGGRDMRGPGPGMRGPGGPMDPCEGPGCY